ncbi:CHAT domain-containing protein [Scytonema sp. UIC 10036]|uniref:CHAT domain-containing protein n=1 Tax=Scytonema sp. UIC 10036 TaxID=2304196 RepID=UPI0012DA4312|nr:CHAT domain-containing protein [Scytonema sp. UIC 10036]MUG93729.1 CHAT domain-containing protein [Scytonema sp. UIC 10036]
MSVILTLATLSQIMTPLPLAAQPVSQMTVPAVVRSPFGRWTLTQSPSQTDTKQLLQQGLQLYQAEKFADAVKVFKQASQAFQAVEDELNQALALNYLSLAHQQLGELAKAEKAIDNSLALLHNKNGSKEYLSIRAQALNTKGKLQLVQGQPEQALKSWEEATVVYKQIGDEAGSTGSQINQAQALQALGLYRRANNTLDAVEQSTDKQSDSIMKATRLLSLGNTLRVVGNLGKSQQVLLKSLIIAQRQQSKEKVAEIQLSLGNTAQALANNETEEEKNKGYIQKSLNYYRQAASTSEKALTQLESQLNELRLLRLGVDKLLDQQRKIQLKLAAADKNKLSEPEKKELSEQVQRISQEVQNNFSDIYQRLFPQIQSRIATVSPSRSSINAHINFAQSLIKLKQKNNSSNISWREIAEIVKVSVNQAQQLQDNRAYSHALGILGNLYEQTQQWSEAQNLTEQAVKLGEGISASDIAYRWRWQLGRILRARGDNEEAKASYQQAINHLKSLRNDLAVVNRDVQFSFRDEVEPVYREYVSFLLEGNSSEESIRVATEVIDSLQVAELDNFFRRACVDAKTVQLDEIDKKNNTVFIYPLILPDRLAVIASLPNGAKRRYTFDFPKDESGNFITSDKMEQTIEELSQKLSNRNSGEFLPDLHNFYKWLVQKTLDSDLKKGTNLVFILDGALRNIPMAALYDGKQFLIEKEYNLALTPGLQLLPTITPLTAERLERRAVIAGLSELPKGIEQKYSGRFNALPKVADEVNQIAKEVKIPVRQRLLNNQFTRTTITEAVKSSNAPVIHLATHGQFSSQAENTFILTWNGEVNVNELKSVLRTRETKQQEAIELLVLSACQTAKGDNRATLGIAGVAIQSGARSTLATLWSVTDDTTATVMTEFYNNLVNKKMPKAEALRQAQVNLLKNHRHPYFWAPYILVGNWQ